MRGKLISLCSSFNIFQGPKNFIHCVHFTGQQFRVRNFTFKIPLHFNNNFSIGIESMLSSTISSSLSFIIFTSSMFSFNVSIIFSTVRFLNRYQGHEDVKYRFVKRESDKWRYPTIRFPKEYNDDKIFLKDIWQQPTPISLIRCSPKNSPQETVL
jgi:hypothetical protein